MTYVEIVDQETEEVIRRFGPHDQRTADRIEDGANINLNHERYFTRQVPAKHECSSLVCNPIPRPEVP